MKKYIVTGGAGFIGSNLVKRLIDKGAEVYVIDDLSTGFIRNIPEGAVLYKTDITRFNSLCALRLPAKIDAVFHLAAQSSGEASFDDPGRDTEINYGGTYNILKLAHRSRCKRFIYASSMSVYGPTEYGIEKVMENHPCNPVSYYGNNKLASEGLIKIFAKTTGMEPTIFRLFSVYGPGQNMNNMKQGIVSIYLSYLLNGRPVKVKGSLDRFRDLVYIDDVIDVLVLCEDKKGAYGQVFNIGTGIKTTVRDLLKTLLMVYGIENFDKWIRCEGNTPGDVNGCVADISKVKRVLGWSPRYGVADGVGKMQSWLDDTRKLWVKS